MKKDLDFPSVCTARHKVFDSWVQIIFLIVEILCFICCFLLFYDKNTTMLLIWGISIFLVFGVYRFIIIQIIKNKISYIKELNTDTILNKINEISKYTIDEDDPEGRRLIREIKAKMYQQYSEWFTSLKYSDSISREWIELPKDTFFFVKALPFIEEIIRNNLLTIQKEPVKNDTMLSESAAKSSQMVVFLYKLYYDIVYLLLEKNSHNAYDNLISYMGEQCGTMYREAGDYLKKCNSNCISD